MPSLPLDDWLNAAARDLDARLRGGAGDRQTRRTGRRLLRRAFDAREREAVTAELVRSVDRAAHPLTARIPAPPRIGIPPLPTRPSRAWLDRLCAVERTAEAIAGRTERMLDGLRSEEVRRALWPVVARGADDQPEMAFTEG